jgi:cytidylate kinase
MPVITIGRQFGAGGETIGSMVAQRLGAEVVDRKIFEEVAIRLELTHDEVEKQDEAAGSFLNRVLQALGGASIEFAAPPEAAAWTPPYSDPSLDTRKAVLKVTQEVIREAARTGNAVIVGRGAAYMLLDHPGVLNVFIRASESVRIQHVRQLQSLNEEQARKRIKQIDANRGAYIRQVYDHDWLHPSHYHMVLDSGRLGFERTADAIVAVAH